MFVCANVTQNENIDNLKNFTNLYSIFYCYRWRDFSCTCERPYLGHTCQYNYTAGTFGYENITDSLVTVDVADNARKAVRSIVDISMFIRTRQSRGQIFYLGSGVAGDESDENFIKAQLEGGELLVKIQFNGSLEGYTVGGVKLNNGYNHLIEVRTISIVLIFYLYSLHNVTILNEEGFYNGVYNQCAKVELV